MEKILITGVNGMLGHELVKQLLEKGFRVIGTSKGEERVKNTDYNYCYHPLDITSETDWMNVISNEKPTIIVHAAAMTQADECELNKEKCLSVNYCGTLYGLKLAATCSHFIYISTDFVFDGEKARPDDPVGRGMYTEDDSCIAPNFYGETKLKSEEAVKQSLIPWTIVRTCLVYGEKTRGGRDNIITWADGKLSKGEKIKVVDDQVRTPTYIGDLTKGIIGVIQKKATGIYHLSGKDVLTPYQMAMAVAEYKGYDKFLIERVTADTFTQPAKRPAKTGFIIDKAIKELNYQPISFEEGIKKVLG
jgi:dTDP-4-dehydrorhamnose reductase